MAAPAAPAPVAVGGASLLLALHLNAQASCPLLGLWAAARCRMQECAPCLAAAVAAPHAMQCMQDGAAGVHPSGVAIQAAVLAEETAEDAAAAAAIDLLQRRQAEAAALSGHHSVLPAAEEAAVMTEAAAVLAAAEEAAALTEHSARCCFGILQTPWLLQMQQAGTCQTSADSDQPPSRYHQCHAPRLCLKGR